MRCFSFQAYCIKLDLAVNHFKCSSLDFSSVWGLFVFFLPFFFFFVLNKYNFKIVPKNSACTKMPVQKYRFYYVQFLTKYVFSNRDTSILVWYIGYQKKHYFFPFLIKKTKIVFPFFSVCSDISGGSLNWPVLPKKSVKPSSWIWHPRLLRTRARVAENSRKQENRWFIIYS